MTTRLEEANARLAKSKRISTLSRAWVVAQVVVTAMLVTVAVRTASDQAIIALLMWAAAQYAVAIAICIFILLDIRSDRRALHN